MEHAGLFAVAVVFLPVLLLSVIEVGMFISDVSEWFMSIFDYSESV